MSTENAKNFLKILSPFAPFVVEEIWRTVFGERSTIHLEQRPESFSGEIKEEIFNAPVQVNGKLRAVIVVLADQQDERNVVQKALENEKVEEYVGNKKYKVIYRPGKILSFITTE